MSDNAYFTALAAILLAVGGGIGYLSNELFSADVNRNEAKDMLFPEDGVYRHYSDESLRDAMKNITAEDRFDLVKRLAEADPEVAEGLKESSGFLSELATDAQKYRDERAELVKKYTGRKPETEEQEIAAPAR